MPARTTDLAAALLSLLAAATLIACESTAEPDPPAGPTLEPVTPLALTGTAGGPLKTAPTVRAVGGDGQPLPGLTVQWSTAAGTLGTQSVVTDAHGIASTLWVPPPSPGVYSVAASTTDGAASVEFEATTVPDVVAPALVGLTFGLDTVWVNGEPAALEVEITSTDEGSGVYWTVLDLRGPSGIQSTYCSDLAPWNDTTSLRTVTCALEIPAFAEDGSWRIHHLVLQDRIGNESQAAATDLDDLAIPAGVEVVSAEPDTLPPYIATLAFLPDTVDVTNDDGVVTFIARLTDDRAGVTAAQLAIDEPGGHWAECLEMDLVEGAAEDGAWTCDVTIPAGSRPGQWTLRRLTAWDGAANWHSYMAEDLAADGHPTRITVVNDNADLEPPTLLTVDASPDTANIATGPVDIEVSLGVADPGTGVASTTVFLRAPGASSASGCAADSPVEGTRPQGIFRCSITIPGEAVEGDWRLDGVSITDAAGNVAEFSSAALEEAGFAITVTVIR